MTLEQIQACVRLTRAFDGLVVAEVTDDLPKLTYRVTVSFEIPYELLQQVFPEHTGTWGLDQVREAVADTYRRIRLVKEERERTGCGMKEACDRLEARGWA